MPLFLFIFHILYILTFIQSQFIHPSPFAEASLHFFIACMLSGEDLPVVPSRESNSGLPYNYSKPTRYQLSHAAPLDNWYKMMQYRMNEDDANDWKHHKEKPSKNCI
jgi:hypothetical protein